EAEAEESQVAGPLEHIVGPGGLLPLVAVGPELLLHPCLHRLAQVFVLLREDHVLALGAVVGLDDFGAVGRRSRHWCLLLASFAAPARRPPIWGEWTVALLTFSKRPILVRR